MLSKVSRGAFSQVRAVWVRCQPRQNQGRRQTNRLERCCARIIHAAKFLRDSRAPTHIWCGLVESRRLSLIPADNETSLRCWMPSSKQQGNGEKKKRRENLDSAGDLANLYFFVQKGNQEGNVHRETAQTKEIRSGWFLKKTKQMNVKRERGMWWGTKELL